MSDIVKRRGRPHSTMVGLQERLERYRVAERCAEVTDEIIDFWISCFRNRKFSPSFRAEMADRPGVWAAWGRGQHRRNLAGNVDQKGHSRGAVAEPGSQRQVECDRTRAGLVCSATWVTTWAAAGSRRNPGPKINRAAHFLWPFGDLGWGLGGRFLNLRLYPRSTHVL
jgi:hypothetical protein